MAKIRPIHPDFQMLLDLKSENLITLFKDLRQFMFTLHPGCNELLYHTHALTAVFSLSDKLADAYCTVPIYANHLNLAFNKGTRLKDTYNLLTGTGNLMRHIDVNNKIDYRNPKVTTLIKEAYEFAKKDMDRPISISGITLSKIKPLK